MSVKELDKYLTRFYAELRKKDGSHYSRSSIHSIRYGLQQHFNKTHGIDIITDEQCKASNEMFGAVLVQLKQIGKGSVLHKQPLSNDDFLKLYASDVLNTSTPAGLQNKVFVDVMVQLCNRGRENLREMSRHDFVIATDSTGLRYVRMKDKKTKNHRGDIGDENSQQGRMYGTPGYPRCPVSSFEKYVSKLHQDCTAFWQKPDTCFTESSTKWYCNAPVGKNILYEKMKVLSKAAGLSTIYTNHCLRATCITALAQHGFEARHIMAVSGQKSESSSIRFSSRNVSDQRNEK